MDQNCAGKNFRDFNVGDSRVLHQESGGQTIEYEVKRNGDTKDDKVFEVRLKKVPRVKCRSGSECSGNDWRASVC